MGVHNAGKVCYLRLPCEPVIMSVLYIGDTGTADVAQSQTCVAAN